MPAISCLCFPQGSRAIAVKNKSEKPNTSSPVHTNSMKHIARGISAALMVFALAGCGGGDDDASPSVATAPTGRLSALRATGNVVSAAPMSATAPVHVALVLKLNDEAGLSHFLQDARTPGSARFGAVLTSAQIAAQYAPTAEQVANVEAYLGSKGFTNIKVADNNMIVEADAPAGVISGVFQTSLVPVAMADGTNSHINTAPEIVPNAISGVVQGFSGSIPRLACIPISCPLPMPPPRLQMRRRRPPQSRWAITRRNFPVFIPSAAPRRRPTPRSASLPKAT
ncbi:protease pro-enzyme activation domain-containing protein [Burkholderia sp. FXe9]|nr:protease pro-enzyme activation domain-containing protein [Burkholderia sp. FXe9]